MHDYKPEIISTLRQYDENTLRKILALLIQTYVINNGLDFDDNVYTEEKTPSGTNKSRQNNSIISFSDLIRSIKEEYSFAELELFSIENGKVILNFNNEKICISREDNHSVEHIQISEENERLDNENNRKSSSYSRFKNLEME